MPPLRTSIGQIMVNDALPEDMRDYNRTLDKKSLTSLLREVAQKHPDDYREISHALSRIGQHAAYTTGGNSFGLRHMRMTASARLARQKLRAQIREVSDDDNLTDNQRNSQLVRLAGRLASKQQTEIFDESLAEGNPLATQVLSGAKGSKMNLASLRGSDLLYTDHRGKVLPIPVLKSYSQGLSPTEYWAGSYGARKGVIDLKFATQQAGFLSKQLNQIAHRALVTSLDADKEPDTLRGFPVETDDEDNEGTLLSYPVAGYKRNTVLTPKILADMRRKKIQRILVRSPAVSGTEDGGLYARDVGVREFGRLPATGENIGLTAAQALSEPLTQAQISSKHTGGVSGAGAEAAIGGFDRINQLIQTPKTFKGGAAHSRIDGLVQFVEDAPAGGMYVTIDGDKHYVGDGFDLKVKKGDHVEAGDVISEGIPNPSTIVQHKGVGEGRRYFVKTFREAFDDAGIGRKTGTRRNIEVLARGLINHVRLTDEVGDFAPDDVVPYSMLEHRYKPRADALPMQPKRAVGHYLEKPYLHYSVGTKVKPSMLRDFSDFGVKEVVAHPEAPPFQPEMIRGMATLQHDPDWMTRMFGSGLKSSLLKGVHRGAVSDPTGTSFVPSLANPVTFGQVGKVITPKREDDQDRAQKQFKLAAVDPARAQRSAAFGHIAQQQDARDQALRLANQEYQRQTGGSGSGASLGWDLAQWAPGVWPTFFTSGGSNDEAAKYPPIFDSQGNAMPGGFVNWYNWGGKQEELPSRHIQDFQDIPTFGEDAPDMSSLGIDPGNLPRQPDEYNKGMTRGWDLQKDLLDKYPEEWQAAQQEYWTPERSWKSGTPEQRVTSLQKVYAEAGVTPVRSLQEIANSPEPPPEYMQFYDPQGLDPHAVGADGRQLNLAAKGTAQSPEQLLQSYRNSPEIQQLQAGWGKKTRIAMAKQQTLIDMRYRNGEISAQEASAQLANLYDTARKATIAGDSPEASNLIGSYNPVGNAATSEQLASPQAPQQPPQQQPAQQQPAQQQPGLSANFQPSQAPSQAPPMPQGGFLPFAQAMHGAAPGSMDQVMRNSGAAAPLLVASLFDPQAVGRLTGSIPAGPQAQPASPQVPAVQAPKTAPPALKPPPTLPKPTQTAMPKKPPGLPKPMKPLGQTG